MIEGQKTLKQYCREAKKRLKQGFWQNYHKNLQQELDKAKQAGVSASRVREFYENRVVENIKSRDCEKEEFYNIVKKMLEEEGEVSNAIGRLTDNEYFETLSYEEKQRYTLTLSEKYLQAVERYRKEKILQFN